MLEWLNGLRWWRRLPLKWAIFLLTVAAVCFPHPRLVVRHIQHWRDPNALIDPDAPELRPLVEQLRVRVTDDLTPKQALAVVQRFVYEAVPYEWDWNTWGMADYLPTVSEVLEAGKEDCDGQALIAASLLRNLGYESELVTDFFHVWVKTEHGETMGPGQRTAVEATQDGLKLHWDAFAQLPQAVAFGIAVFPAGRELIVLAVLWLLLLHPGRGKARALIALALLVAAWLFLRIGSLDHRQPILWMQIVALGNGVAALVVLYAHTRRNAARPLCDSVDGRAEASDKRAHV